MYEGQKTQNDQRIGVPIPFEFTGSAGEYFRIWIVLVFKTIFTLGIYSAWAKVIRKKYFSGHSKIIDDRLDYHATGMQIFKGRLIVIGFIVLISILGEIDPMVEMVLSFLIVPIIPWAINRSLKFNARMTSWRNVRFDWHGSYGMTVLYMVLLPVIGVITLGLMMPWVSYKQRTYFIQNLTLGDRAFYADMETGPFFKAGFMSVLVFLGIAGVVAFISYLITIIFSTGMGSFSIWHNVTTFIFIPLLIAMYYYGIMTRKIMINALEMGVAGGPHAEATFNSNISGLKFVWITISNLVAIICSLGLLIPWATIRSYRYQLETTSVIPQADIQTFTDSLNEAGDATGGELSDFEGWDVSI